MASRKSMPPGVPLSGRAISSDEAIRRAINAEARAARAQREIAALTADRNELLYEHDALRTARPVPTQKPPKKRSGRDDIVRVSLGDLHGMRQDPAAVAALLADVRALDPDELVIGGDMIDCSGWLAKHQTLAFVTETDYSFQEDVAAANTFFDALQQAAPKAAIDYLEGNHEGRIERGIVDNTLTHQRDGAFLVALYGPETVLRLRERGIRYYRRSEVYVDGAPRGWIKKGKMFFFHGMDKGGVGKAAASRVADAAAVNVTFFHSHRADSATRVFPDNRIVKVFNPGCLCLMQPTWQNTNISGWSQGYCIDIVARSGNFQHIQVPIWRGESLAGAMISRFRRG